MINESLQIQEIEQIILKLVNIENVKNNFLYISDLYHYQVITFYSLSSDKNLINYSITPEKLFNICKKSNKLSSKISFYNNVYGLLIDKKIQLKRCEFYLPNHFSKNNLNEIKQYIELFTPLDFKIYLDYKTHQFTITFSDFFQCISFCRSLEYIKIFDTYFTPSFTYREILNQIDNSIKINPPIIMTKPSKENNQNLIVK